MIDDVERIHKTK